MKTFLAVYTGTPDAIEIWRQLPEKERLAREKAGMAAWHAWVEKNKNVIQDIGGPLGRTKRITSAGIADIRNNMAAFTLVKAESHGAAAQLFENHPHFSIFPGDGVEVMECLPVPEMS
ncbi:MAG: hypothetical protein U1F34_02385 [Gammaproteobacteria bacterium]